MMDIPSIKLEAANSSDQLLACRICLATDTKLFNIFDNGLDTTFLELMGIVVSPVDGCPGHVCCWCGRLLRRALALRQRCRRSDALLKQALRQQHITNSVIQNIDRVSHNLTLPLTVTNTEIIECEHTEPIIIKHEVEVQLNDVNDDTIVKFEDINIEAELEVEYKNDQIEAKSEVKLKETEVKKLRTSKRKKKNVSENECKEKEPKKTKKIKKMFECEEDFPKFESKYNIEIVVFTTEQQLENMAARKNSSNYVNSPFKCELCFKGFSSEATLKNHNLKHHDSSVGVQICRLCHSRFRIPADLRRHAETHRLKFVCRDCPFVTSNRDHAIRHSREHSGFKYVCKYCGASFKKPSTHGTHVRIQHPTQNTSCDVCGETFQGEFGLRMHKTRAHKQSSENESESLNCSTCGVHFASSYAMARHTYTAVDNVCNPNMRACTLCGENLTTDELLLSHTEARHSKPETKCDECNKTFLTEASLSVHYERVHLQVKKVRRNAPHHAKVAGSQRSQISQSSKDDQKSLNCSTCGVHFASSYAMARHINKAVDNVCNPNMRACTLCGENLTTDELLLSHTEARHSKPETKCDECNKTFLTEASRSVHYERVHLQVKNVRRKAVHHAKVARKQHRVAVICELCGKKCQNSTFLKYHQRTHTGEKPHPCPRCPKRFASPMLLHCHLRSHTGEKPYKCAQCHKSFAQKPALVAHSTVHTGEKPFACPICGKSFTQSASVHTHVKYVHMKMPAPPRRQNMKRD